MRRRDAAALGLALVLAGAGTWRAATERPIHVPPGGSVPAAIREAGPGGTIRLLPGLHPPFEVAARVTVEGMPGARARGPVTVAAEGASLRDLTIVGGETGVIVDRARDVTLERLTVRGAELHGIEVIMGTAAVRACSIAGLTSPFAQAIEVRNANGLGRSLVDGCTVEGGQEGIVSHVSRIAVRDNVVRGTSLRAIAVTEMSEGVVEGNTVRDAVGIGIYCGDESRCEIRRNDVSGVAADPAGVRSRAGYAVVGWYRSVVRLEENRLDGAVPDPVGLFLSSVRTERFPLVLWPPGWTGALPAIAVGAAALAGIALVRAGAARWLRRRREPLRSGRISAGALGVLVGGFAVQSFHMLEHGVQVVQVYVLDSPVRSGLAGQVVDTEWVHFAYNVAVMAFLLWAWRLVRPRGPVAAAAGDGGSAWMLAAVVVQGYHVLEHVAKIVQHVGWGIDPAPGLLGGAAGLVWFHFGINLAVYAAMAVPLARVLVASLGPRLEAAEA